MDNRQDWGRDGTMAVATRYLGWRLADVVREVPGLKYAAAAQWIRRTRVEHDNHAMSVSLSAD